MIALKGVENIVRVGKRQGGVLKFCVQGPGKLFFFQGLVGRERFFFFPGAQGLQFFFQGLPGRGDMEMSTQKIGFCLENP